MYNVLGSDYMNIKELNVLILAYLGDSVYENYIRKYLISQNIANVNDLQKEAIKYVSAKNQAKFLTELMDKNFFTPEELTIIKRARNCKTKSHPKNCDIITYKYATGLESLIGYLELEGKTERIKEIMNFITGGNKC